MKWLPALALGLVAAGAAPCIWDSDTLDTELRGLPDAFDLVVGRWHRHSDAYYRARVDRLADKDDKSLADYDDLAVGYERLGRREEAVEVMAGKAAALVEHPDDEHRYRYHANLGTFHAHAGRYDEALKELRAAVALNPDAHFGRERFQIELIEYVAAAKKDPELWRRFSFLRHAGYRLSAFVGASGLRYAPDDSRDWGADWSGDRPLDLEEAYRGVAGMLRFGGLEGPELYRSLGELFLARQDLNLAWWALGRAIERGHPAADLLKKGQASIEKHWDEARQHNRTGHVNPTAADYDAARAEADRWLAAFQAAEAAAISAGRTVTGDGALEALIAEADAAVPQDEGDAPPDIGRIVVWSLVGCALLGLALLLLRRANLGGANAGGANAGGAA